MITHICKTAALPAMYTSSAEYTLELVRKLLHLFHQSLQHLWCGEHIITYIVAHEHLHEENV